MVNTINKIIHNSDEYEIPVTSVNGQTGAVTIEVPNTKTFYLSSASDLTTAQAAYDWYKDGKNPIISLSGATYSVREKTSSYLKFTGGNRYVDGNTKSNVYENAITLNLSSDTVTSITNNATDVSGGYLRTGKNYSTPYTPEYDGSPATKKYVDDKQKTISVTLTTAGWSSSTQSVTATGVTASNTVICSPAPSSISDYSDNGVYCSAQSTDSLTFTCDSTPSNDITVNVVIIN